MMSPLTTRGPSIFPRRKPGPYHHESVLWRVACFFFALAIAACDDGGTNATAPGEPPVITHLDLLGPDVVTLNRNESVQLRSVVLDSEGEPVPSGDAGLTWNSRPSDVVSVTEEGVLHGGPGLRDGWVVVEAPGGLRDSVLVWVQVGPGEPSNFRITLLYAEDVPALWRDALDSAARRWEAVIRADLPEVMLDTEGGDCPTAPGEPTSPPLTGAERGVRIYVGQSGQFPAGTFVEAVGGPCLQRPLPAPTTILGKVVLNRDKPVDEIAPTRLSYVAVHEMGHALGLIGLVQGRQPEWYDPFTGIYRGTMALEGRRRDDPESARAQLIVDTGSGHWSFPGDVMSTNPGINHIRNVSVGALMDLGYPAAWYGAGPY